MANIRHSLLDGHEGRLFSGPEQLSRSDSYQNFREGVCVCVRARTVDVHLARDMIVFDSTTLPNKASITNRNFLSRPVYTNSCGRKEENLALLYILPRSGTWHHLSPILTTLFPQLTGCSSPFANKPRLKTSPAET